MLYRGNYQERPDNKSYKPSMHPSTPLAAPDLWQQVRTSDYRRFLAIQRAPASTRPTLYALTAFYQEVAAIAERVSEPMIGAIRLSWWREALDELEQGAAPRAHPVAEALGWLCTQGLIAPAELRPMLEAREAELDPEQLRSESQFNTYLHDTASTLHRLWGKCLGSPPSDKLSEAYALIGIARSIPAMASTGVMRIPGFLCAEYGLPHEANALTPSDAITRITRYLCTRAEAQLGEEVPSGAFSALRAIAVYDAAQLRKAGYDPYACTRKPAGSLGLVWRVLRS